MLATSLLLAFAGSVSAVNFPFWVQHNGLVSSYNKILLEHGPFGSAVSNARNITCFVPVNSAVSTWLDEPSTQSMSYAAANDTLLYMVVQGGYSIQALEGMNGQLLDTLLPGEKVKVHVTGIQPDLTVLIGSGDNYMTNSTVGIYNDDFHVDNGYVQTIGTVFKLPSAILAKANKDTAKNAAPKATIGAAGLLSAVAIGLMALY